MPLLRWTEACLGCREAEGTRVPALAAGLQARPAAKSAPEGCRLRETSGVEAITFRLPPHGSAAPPAHAAWGSAAGPGAPFARARSVRVLAGLVLFGQIVMLAPMSTDTPSRIALVDIARTLALCGMILFHFVLDLELFGYLPQGTVALPGAWAIFARCVAGSFLFLAGASLVLAHGAGIRWRPFLRRLGILSGAALAVSLATYAAVPQAFIYFGILHAMATFSVIGLLFLRLPAGATLAVAGAVVLLSGPLASPALQSPWLVWLGLSQTRPFSMDFVPLFPWFGALLTGIAVTRAAKASSLWPLLGRPPGDLGRRLTWPGRHSLVIYLLHQPVLIGLIWTFTRVTG